MLSSGKTYNYAIMHAKTLEIRIVAFPHLKDPSWEGGRGVPQICAQIYMRIYPKTLFHHAARRKAAADLEGFAHSAAAQLETAQEIRRINVSESAI